MASGGVQLFALLFTVRKKNNMKAQDQNVPVAKWATSSLFTSMSYTASLHS